MNRLSMAAVIVAAMGQVASAGTYLGLGIGTAANASADNVMMDGDGRSGRLMLGYRFSRIAIEGSGTRYDLIVGNLIMVVVEKGREIALLKTLGASDRNVMLVFTIQGMLIGVVGTALGISTGLLACWFGKAYGIPLNPDVYYIDRMPVHVDPTSVIVTAAAGVLISMAATFYPALVAARVRPAAGMRH